MEKNIFSINRNETKSDGQEGLEREDIKNYSDHGFERAQSHQGNHTALGIELNKIYHQFLDECRQDEEQQDENNRPKRVKLEGLKSENEELRKENERIKNTEKPSKEEKINDIKDDIRKIKKNPEEVSGDEVSKVGYYIGILIIIPLSIYLFIFYSSASFSAIFKEFTLNNLGVANSIFDPRALSIAWSEGVTELILLVTIPFVFIALGYLIYKYKEEKKYLELAFFLLCTFIFDCILAFEITQKIYELTKTINQPVYGLAQAATNIKFWLIICAGFLVYIVWGSVFNFIMEAYDKLNKVKVAIREKKSKINSIEKGIEISEKRKYKNEYKISENKTRIKKLEEKIKSITYSREEFETRYNEFLSGWIEYLNSNRFDESKVKKAREMGDHFIEIELSINRVQNNE